jgi:hypothetical protein
MPFWLQDDTCSALAQLATDALYAGKFDTAACILATVFIQGAPGGEGWPWPNACMFCARLLLFTLWPAHMLLDLAFQLPH